MTEPLLSGLLRHAEGQANSAPRSPTPAQSDDQGVEPLVFLVDLPLVLSDPLREIHDGGVKPFDDVGVVGVLLSDVHASTLLDSSMALDGQSAHIDGDR